MTTAESTQSSAMQALVSRSIRTSKDAATFSLESESQRLQYKLLSSLCRILMRHPLLHFSQLSFHLDELLCIPLLLLICVFLPEKHYFEIA